MRQYLIVIILCVLLLMIIVMMKNTKNKEHLTLKKECDERNRSCFIACTKSNNTLDVACYKECVINSPIC